MKFLALPLLIVALVTGPRRAKCPPDFYVNGARDGVYQCRRAYSMPDDCTKMPRGCVERPDPRQVSYTGYIYCTNGMITVQDGSSVWCEWRNR